MEIVLKNLERKILTFPEQAKEIAVIDAESLERAHCFLLGLKSMQKRVDETFDPIIQKAHQAHKEAIEQKRKFEYPLSQAERIIKPQISSYLAEMERIRREAEEKARKEREEAERKMREEEERRLQAAIEAEEQGRTEEAEKILNEEPEISVAKVETFVPEKIKLQGTSLRKIVKWRCVNLKEVPRDMLMLDSAKITRLVKETKGQIRIPGIEVYFEDGIASRGF